MELTVREVATLLHISQRTVRSQLASGAMPGRKVSGRWRVPKQHLPLTELQRRALDKRAQIVREAVDRALPSRRAKTPGDRRRRLEDVDSFRLGLKLYGELRSSEEAKLDLEWASDELRLALLDLAVGVAQFEPELKLRSINRARARMARLGASFVLSTTETSEPKLERWVEAIEDEILPAIASYARWADRLSKPRTNGRSGS